MGRVKASVKKRDTTVENEFETFRRSGRRATPRTIKLMTKEGRASSSRAPVSRLPVFKTTHARIAARRTESLPLTTDDDAQKNERVRIQVTPAFVCA